MAARKRSKKSKHPEEKRDSTPEENKSLSSEDEAREDLEALLCKSLFFSGEQALADNPPKKRPSDYMEADLPEPLAVGNEVQSMLEKFGADISKVMHGKRKRLESLTKTSLKGSHHKLEQLWNSQYAQRQKLTQDYSQQVSSVLQQWETEAQRAEDQEEKLNSMEEMEKSHEAFLQGAQQELKKEMASLQKKILMDTQQQEMATVRKSLHSMLF